MLLTFDDLKARGVVNNRTQLARLIANASFPKGFLLSANARRWDESEIETWLQGRRERAA
ncbi:MAG: helix-turn-helix transcriptional regulator [Caulobacterales bacterium]